MEINDILNQVDIEEIYRTVLDLEGPKYPIDDMPALNDAAEYILNKLKSYGIETEVQEFYLDGFDEPFKNLFGLIGDQAKPAIVIGSHYDTVRNCPAANDNISSIAVSLEIARILSKVKNPPTVIIAVFTLEEGHPSFKKKIEQKFHESGIYDIKHRFTSAKLFKLNRKINQMIRAKRAQTNNLFAKFKEVSDELKESLDSIELKLLNSYIETIKEYTNESKEIEMYICVGSHQYVKKIIKENIKISNIINYDVLGWSSNAIGTQKKLPISEEMNQFVKLHKTEFNSTVGNFIAVMGEKNSQPILNEFLKQCESPDIDIPFVGLCIPLKYDEIEKMIPDVLRSDHQAFWKAGIPGIFISDTANFRSDYYHTPADTYEKLNYDVLVKIVSATLRTLLSISPDNL